MSSRRYYRLSLLLPMILPFLAVIGGENFLTDLLIGTVLFSSIPYLIFAGLFWAWLEEKTIKSIQQASYLAPLLFVPFQVIFLLLLLTLSPPSEIFSVDGMLTAIGEFMFYALMVGYLYVFIINLGYFWLSKIGVVRE